MFPLKIDDILYFTSVLGLRKKCLWLQVRPFSFRELNFAPLLILIQRDNIYLNVPKRWCYFAKHKKINSLRNSQAFKISPR